MSNQSKKTPLMHRFRRLLLTPLAIVITLFIVVEEIIWRVFSGFTAWISSWSVWANLEKTLSKASPRFAALSFLVPLTMVFVIEAMGGWVASNGHVFLGATIYLTVKVVGTAIAARIYTITKDALQTIPWFARLTKKITQIKLTLISWSINSSFLKQILNFVRYIRLSLRRKRRFWLSRSISRIRANLKKHRELTRKLEDLKNQ